MTSKREVGNRYEEKASQFLEKKGHRILEKNVNYKWGEIDLVTFDPQNHELVFVEVRHRAELGMLSPAESVNRAKLRRLRRAIDTFLASSHPALQGLRLSGARIDLVSFEGEKVSHWTNFV